MADNIVLNPGTGGSVVATDEILGVQHELVKIEYGLDGSATMVSPSTPLPVTDAVAEAALTSLAAEDFATSAKQDIQTAGLASILAKLSNDPATQTTLVAILNKIIAAPSTEAKQDTIIAALNSIDAGTAAALGQALMAASVPVTIASDQSPLSIGAITPGTGATNLGKVEDSPHTTGDVGVMSLGVRNDAASPLAANGDYIPLSTDEVGAVWGATVGRISANNSTTATLLAGAVFTGTSEEVKNFASIQVSAFSNVASATDGLSLQQSQDATNWDFIDTYTIAAGTGKVFSVQPSARYFRVVYTNGGTNQAAFRLQIVYHTNAAKPSSQRPSDAYTNETDLEQQQSFLMGYNGTTWDRLRSSIANGLQVDVTRMPGSATDNTQLYSNTLSVVGSITGIDTTGYTTIVFQISGVWAGNMIIEGSGDNSIWEALLTMDINELSVIDTINENGLYVIRTTSKFVRLNVQQIQSGSISALIIGRTVLGISAIERLSMAMDRNNNMPLYVEETATKKDVSKALIPSDAPAPIYGFSAATNAINFFVDTTGYQSVVVQIITAGTTLTAQGSNDGVNWTSINGLTTFSSTPTSTIQSSGNVFVFPCATRFVRGLSNGTGLTTVFVYLRQQPPNLFLTSGLVMNIAAIGGTPPVTAGVSGMLAVGGNIANGVAPTANPNLIAGIDTSGLTRRVLTDTTGRVITAGVVDQVGTTRQAGALTPASNQYNVAAQVFIDASTSEGQSVPDLLQQILLELRINNQMMSELPVVLQGQNGKFDEPSQFRNDQTLFAI